MQQFLKISVIMAALCLLCGSTVAQNLPQTCSESSSMKLNTDQLLQISGAWFEVARNPFLNLYACVEVDISVSLDNSTMFISTTFSDTPTALWQNSTMNATITLDSNNNGAGYNISYSLNSQSTPPILYKLLTTDFNNYAVVCGYTNATDNADSFGTLLTRQRNPSPTELGQIESMASATYANFLNGTMPLITQSESCYTAAASAAAPIFTAMLVALFAIMKIMN